MTGLVRLDVLCLQPQRRPSFLPGVKRKRDAGQAAERLAVTVGQQAAELH